MIETKLNAYKTQRLNYISTNGLIASAMEHVVPEKIFSTKDNPAKGISAVKAISLAAKTGQTIWRITNDNLSSALNAINLGVDIETEIRNSVLAGKIVTTHTSPVNFGSGTNIGYIIVDHRYWWRCI